MPFVKFSTKEEIEKQCAADSEFKRIHEENERTQPIRQKLRECVRDFDRTLDPIEVAEMADELYDKMVELINNSKS